MDKTKDWDAAMKRTMDNGFINERDRTLFLTSCPTCCDSGMDEGLFCKDCNLGRRLAQQAGAR